MNLLPDIFNRPLRQLQSWSNFFDEDLPSQELPSRGVRIYEQDNQLHVEFPLPGLKLDDIEVSLNKGILLVRGECKEEEQDKSKKFYRSSKRKYSYSIALPSQIDERQEPQALYQDGILDVSLHLAAQGETRRITVRSAR